MNRRWRPEASSIHYGINPSVDVWLHFRDAGLERGYRQYAALDSTSHDASRLMLMAITHTIWALYSNSYKNCTKICAATYGVLLFEYLCLSLLPSAFYAKWRWTVMLACRLCLCTMSSRWSQQCLMTALGAISSYGQLARFVLMCTQAMPEFIWQLVYSVPNSKVMLAMSVYTLALHTLVASPSMCASLLGEHGSYSIPQLQPLLQLLGGPASLAASTATAPNSLQYNTTAAAAAAPGTCAAATYTGGLCLWRLLEQPHGWACFKAANAIVAALSVALPLLVWLLFIERRQRLLFVTNYVDFSGIQVLGREPPQLHSTRQQFSAELQQTRYTSDSPASSAASCSMQNSSSSGSNAVAELGQPPVTDEGGIEHSSSAGCGAFKAWRNRSTTSRRQQIAPVNRTATGMSDSTGTSSAVDVPASGSCMPAGGSRQQNRLTFGAVPIQSEEWIEMDVPANIAAHMAVKMWMQMGTAVWLAWTLGVFAAYWLYLVEF